MERKTLASLAVAALLAPHALPSAAQGADRFEGSWINDVKIVSCENPNVVLAAFTSMTSYLRGGVVIEGGAPSTPPPAVSRSAGHGVWKREGHKTLHAWIRSHSFDAVGRLVRITEVSTAPVLTNGDNPYTPGVVEPYYLAGWGTNRITNLDPATGAVLSVTEGCNYAASRPVRFD